MKKTIAVLLMVTMLGGLAGGCANIQNDSTRTKTEAAMVGGGSGGVIGAIIGGAAGGRQGALIGAGIGLLAGGFIGFLVGSHIADQKEKYASEEAWLDACLTRAEQTNTVLKEYNTELTAEIAKADKETKNMQAAYEKHRVDQKAMTAERKKLEKMIADTDKVIASIDQEIGKQETVLADARENRKSDEAALLDAEIAALRRQKKQLEESNRQLAAISSRISV